MKCELCQQDTNDHRWHVENKHNMKYKEYEKMFPPVRRTATPCKEDEVRFQLQIIEPIAEESKANLDRWARTHWRRRGRFLQSFIVKRELVDNEEKLSRFVFEHYGFGEFNVNFWKMVRSRWYRKTFNCTQPACHWFQNKTCKTWRTYYTGRACKANRKDVWTFSPYVRIILKPSSMDDNGFEYHLPKMKNNMWRFKWWKGTEKPQRLTAEEEFY